METLWDLKFNGLLCIHLCFRQEYSLMLMTPFSIVLTQQIN